MLVILPSLRKYSQCKVTNTSLNQNIHKITFIGTGIDFLANESNYCQWTKGILLGRMLKSHDWFADFLRVIFSQFKLVKDLMLPTFYEKLLHNWDITSIFFTVPKAIICLDRTIRGIWKLESLSNLLPFLTNDLLSLIFS